MLAACGGGGGGNNPPIIHAPNPPAQKDANPPAQPENPPAVVPEQPSPPPAVVPEQPAPPPVEPNTDKKTFDTLSINAPHQGGAEVQRLLNITLNGKNIELAMVPPNDIVSKQIETLRDKAGNLVGYYGHARIDEPQKDVNGEPAVPKLHHLTLLNAAESLRQLPSSDMKYTGNMFYQYFTYQNPEGMMHKASVEANYSNNNKTMNMLILSDNEDKVWRLRNQRSASASTEVSVSENGSMAGYLFEEYNKAERPKFNGNFTGGFYGENGSVLMGTTHFDGSDAAGTGKWQGVLGATAQ